MPKLEATPLYKGYNGILCRNALLLCINNCLALRYNLRRTHLARGATPFYKLQENFSHYNSNFAIRENTMLISIYELLLLHLFYT